VLNKITLQNICNFGQITRSHMHITKLFLSDAQKHVHQKYPSVLFSLSLCRRHCECCDG